MYARWNNLCMARSRYGRVVSLARSTDRPKWCPLPMLIVVNGGGDDSD